MNPEPPRYIWPRYVLAAFVLGVVLAVIWMSVLVRRTSEQRQDNMWPATNHSILQAVTPPAATNSDPVKTNL